VSIPAPPEVEQEIKNVADGAGEDCAAIDTQRNIEVNRGPKYAGTFIFRITFISIGSGPED
jgi:hypothetical protein